MDSRYGLEWRIGLMGFLPTWTADPSLEVISEIAYRHLKLSPDETAHTTTKLQFQGAFNKLYAVECPRGSFFMRITLPVNPHFKTSSEVATIALLRSRTSVPVPHIIASSSTSDKELKFEWILMERVHGVPLADVWTSLTWDAKVSCVKEVASIMAQLFELRYDSIGNLFNAKDLSIVSERTSQNDASESDIVVLDRLVSMNFFRDTHVKLDVNRGPFASSQDWMEAKFQMLEEDFRILLEDEHADEEDIGEAEKARQQVQRLRKLLPAFFLSDAEDHEEFALHHNDISRHNLILDSKGKLQALVDWECVSVMPLWKACQIPSFLDRPERTERPNPKAYALDSDDNGETACYLSDLYEYECTCLREQFLEEMATLAPRWIVEYERSKLKVDFDLAVQRCSGILGSWRVREWLDRIEAGEEYRRLLEID